MAEVTEREISPALVLLPIGAGLTLTVGLAILALATLARPVGPRCDVAWASILPYLFTAYYYNPATDAFEQVLTDTPLITGATYFIQVTQDCILSYNGYYYTLITGWNEIVWQIGE